MNLCELFANYHSEVRFYDIRNRIRPAYYDGVDLIPLEPSDTQCEFSYSRQIGDTIAITKDMGGCSEISDFVDRKIFVYFCKGLKNKEKIIKKFREATSGGLVTIESVNSNASDLYKKECGGDKILEFKDMTYIGIQYTETYLEQYKCEDCE